MEPIIRTRGLTRRFGDLTAVDHLDLEVAPGSIFGLVGPDGAGKTTTLRLLCGLMDPSEGEARVAGHDTARESQAGLLVNPNQVSVLEVDEATRRREFEVRWQQGGFHLVEAFNDLMITREANDTVAEFVRSKIREVVHDPEVAEKLCPTTIAITW